MSNEETIFAEALGKGSASERSAYLDHACADDSKLRREVESLLLAHDRAAGILEAPPVGIDMTSEIRPAAESVGSTIGPYKLLEQIGGGGMGVVYMAEQLRPVRRKVALKIIKPGMDSGQVIARFEAERQALTMMDHPNIAKVLDASTTEAGRPYFVMELVKGIPITEYCDQARLTMRQRLELFIQVCHAVQHAHQKGVIHRDLKPSNVLVTLHDDKPVPKVIDFGIAKAAGHVLTERTLFTNYAQMLGTPLYMSPEQAQISGLDVDTRSDVYSLGVLLYELLTGTTPFDRQRLREAAYDEMRRIIRDEEPPCPSTRISTMLGDKLATVAAHCKTDPKRLGQLVHGELDWIVMKALEKERARRYETANGLAHDVERHLRDEPVHACPASTTYRFRKFARRHKPALVTAVIVSTSLVIGLGVSIWQATVAHRAEAMARDQWKIAREQKARAEDGERAARRNLHTTNMNLADVAWQRGDVSRMLTLLEAQRPAAGQDDLRGFEWYYLWALCHRGLLGTLHCGSTVRCVGFSGDGRTLASGSDDGTIRLWDLPTKTVRATWSQNRSSVASVAFSPDAKTLCAGRHDGKIELWDLASQQLRVTLPGHTKPVGVVSFSADGQTLFTGDEAGIRLWNLATGREKATINTGEGSGAPAISPDGSTVASGTFQKVRFWDVKTGKARNVKDDHRWRVLAVAFSPDGKFVASGASDEATVRIWEVATGKTHAVLRGHTKEVVSVAFSPDGKQVASASSDGTARVWDLATAKHRCYGHTHSVCSVAFSPDGKTLASAGHDRAIKLWDLEVQRMRLALPPQKGLVWAAKFSPDGRLLATASHHSPPALWDARTGQRRSEFVENGDGAPACLAFSSDGSWLATGAHDQTVRVCDVKTGQVHVALPTFMAHIHGLEFSPDGRSLGASGTSGEIRVWDTTTWQVRTPFPHTGEACWTVSFSPDSARVATKGHTSIKIWNAAGINTATLPCEDCADTTGCAMAFSPDGRTLAALSGGYWSHVTGTEVKLWDLSTSQERQSIPADTITGSAQCMALSSDWKYLAVGSTDGNVRLFDVATGQVRATFSGHQDEVTTIAFSPDGRSMVTGGWDGTVELWHTASEADVLAQSSRDELLVYEALKSEVETKAAGEAYRRKLLTDARPQKKVNLAGDQ